MNLLLTGAFSYTAAQMHALRRLGYRVSFVQDERQPLEADCCRADAVVCNSLFEYADIAGFANLGFIQLTSAGLDRVPLDYIREHHIRLCNAGGVYSAPMAEYALGGILQLYKQTAFFAGNQKNRLWRKSRTLLELSGKTACILGQGSVGLEVARRLRAFNVRVIGVGRRPLLSEALHDSRAMGELPDVLAASDITVLALPLNGQTRHVMDRAMLERCRPGSVLVNIARGGLVDEAALVDALRSGRLMGAVLDVFEQEPLPGDSPLWSMDNVIVTPHNSFVSDGVGERLFSVIYHNLKEFMKTHEESPAYGDGAKPYRTIPQNPGGDAARQRL